MAETSISLQQIEEAIAIFYNPVVSADTAELHKQAQSWLQEAQRSPAGWDIAWALIRNGKDTNSQFFGAHTLQVKIARDWGTIFDDSLDALRNSILAAIIEFAPLHRPSIVLRKLCLALTSFAIHAVPDGKWSKFIPSIFETMQYQAQSPSGPLGAERALLEFLTVIPEEVNSVDLVGAKKTKLLQEVTDSIPLVLSTIQNFLSAPEPYSGVYEKSMLCLLSWMNFGIPLNYSLGPVLNQVLNLLPNHSTFDIAVRVLVELVSHQNTARFEDTICGGLIPMLVSGWVKEEFDKGLRDGDEDYVKNFCNLSCALAETFPDYIIRNITDSSTSQLLEMILMCTAFPGYYGVDEEISYIPLHFWSILQETLADPAGLIKKPSSLSVASSAASSTDSIVLDDEDAPAAPIQLPAEILKCCEIVFLKLVDVLRSKVQWPKDEHWRLWKPEQRQKWIIYRRDVGDTLLVAYYFLREKALQYLFEQAVSMLNQPNRNPNQWEDVESVLFALQSFAEAISVSESTYIPQFLSSSFFVQLPSVARLQKTLLYLIGGYAEWMNSHPESILPALQCLLEGLRRPETASAATSGLKNLCDSCRSKITEGIPWLVNVYAEVKESLRPSDKQRLVESVADVIQALPFEQMLEPLAMITGDILQSINNGVEMAKQQHPDAQQFIINQVNTLTACCRGVQPTESDDEIEIVSSTTSISSKQNPNLDYKKQLEKFLESSDRPGMSMITGIWQVVSGIVETCGSSYAVMESLCGFIDTTLKSSVHLFHLNFDSLYSFVTIVFPKYFHSCVLDTAGHLINMFGEKTYRGNAEHIVKLREMLVIISTVVVEKLQDEKAMEQFPDIVDSFLGLIARAVRHSPSLLYSHFPLDLLNRILQFAVVGLTLQERLASKSAILFMCEFVGQDTSSQRIAPYVSLIQDIINSMGLIVVRTVMMGIGYSSPRSYIPNLSDLLFKFLSRYPDPSRAWLTAVLQEPNFPTPNVSDADKSNFLKQALQTRHLRRFKDIVKDFSVKSRNLEGSKFGTI
ncbi:armadillo-type protein [Paraphysoderma sedebokerense]|nr:armadillo-type protein [Paraphysoderma sedebokerense]